MRKYLVCLIMVALPCVAMAGLTDYQIDMLNREYATFYKTFGTDLDTAIDGAAAATVINDIGDADGNGTINQTTYKQIWTSTLNTAGGVWTMTNTTADLTADVCFLDLKYTDDGDANGFFLRGYDAASSLKWSIGADGAGAFGALSGTTGTFTGALTAAGVTLTGNSTIGDGTGTLAINTSSWDITSAGVLSGLTGLTFSDDLTLATTKALNCATTTAGHVIYLDVYDNDTGPAWVHALSLTNGNTPAVAIGDGTMTVAVDSSTWDVSTAGAFTGVTGLTLATGSAVTVGAVRWDNAADYIDGDMIANDTIDDDSIDFTDVTAADLTLNDATTAIKTTSTLECDGAANLADTTAGANVTIGNSTGNITCVSDNVDFTLTDTTDNAFQLVNSSTAVIFDVDLGATDTVTIGSGAEAIVLATTNLDVAANGDVTATGSITGDGGDEVVGFLKLVTADTDDQALLVTDSGGVWTNTGAIAPQTFTLPAAAAGVEFTFVVMAAQELRIDPAAGDVVYINGTGAEAAEYWTANAVGESVHLIAVDTTNWVSISHTGTWTQETP